MCPRTGTPLIHKAQKSWFIDIQNNKDKLFKENEKINWSPDHLKHGRFAKGMESAPDWCISRTRYWGAPMPVWRSDDGNETLVIGSRDELFQLSKPFKTLTKIILVRHGWTDYNQKHWHDSLGKAQMTNRGQEQMQELAKTLQNEKIDHIYSSPLSRAIDGIMPLANTLGLKVETDELLTEGKTPLYQDIDKGKFYTHFWNETLPEGNETLQDVYKKTEEFMRKLLKNHAGETVVISTHARNITLIQKYLKGFDFDTEAQKYRIWNEENIHGSKLFVTEYVFTDTGKALDLHRPFIDRVKLQSPKTGQTLTRISEVLDVWLDSGSMPYAQMHYPFENKVAMEQSFPADFIAEYVGQVRAWFYVMHVL